MVLLVTHGFTPVAAFLWRVSWDSQVTGSLSMWSFISGFYGMVDSGQSSKKVKMEAARPFRVQPLEFMFCSVYPIILVKASSDKLHTGLNNVSLFTAIFLLPRTEPGI